MKKFNDGDLVRITAVHRDDEKDMIGKTAKVLRTDSDGDVWIDMHISTAIRNNAETCIQWKYGWDCELVEDAS